MKNAHTLACLLAASAVGPHAHATIVWTGAGTDPTLRFAEDNWDFSGSTVTQIDPAVPIEDDVLYQNVNATALDQTVFAETFQLANGFTLTFDNATFDTTGTVGGFNGVDDDPVTNPSVGDPAFINVINGSSLNIQYFSVGLVMTVDSTSTLVFRGGGDPINSQTEGVDLILEPGATLTLPAGGTDDAEFIEQGADILVNGVPFSDGTNILRPQALLFTANTAVAQDFEPADLDIDGDVDDADFGLAFAAFTGPDAGPSSDPTADLDNDGDVDDADFGLAFAAFTGPGVPAATGPEPAGLALLGIGGLVLVRRRRDA